MSAQTKKNSFYILPVFLLISACIWTSSISGRSATLVPLPSNTPAIETAVTSEPTTSPTVVAGSFDDFQLFATEIATALQDRNASFFEEHVAPSAWDCLGDEIQGVCKDIPAGTTLEGIPLTYDWGTYEVYNTEKYRQTWQTRFDNRSALKLVAVANQLGDNPLMPMAGQAFLAIVSVAEENDPSSMDEVHVLFFEYYEQTWHLAGELVTMDHVESWLSNTCATCYDIWVAWPK